MSLLQLFELRRRELHYDDGVRDSLGNVRGEAERKHFAGAGRTLDDLDETNLALLRVRVKDDPPEVGLDLAVRLDELEGGLPDGHGVNIPQRASCGMVCGRPPGRRIQ